MIPKLCPGGGFLSGARQTSAHCKHTLTQSLGYGPFQVVPEFGSLSDGFAKSIGAQVGDMVVLNEMPSGLLNGLPPEDQKRSLRWWAHPVFLSDIDNAAALSSVHRQPWT